MKKVFFWMLVGTPITQEIIFRFFPYQFVYLQNQKYIEIAVVTSFLYALIHWYFGRMIVLGTFILGLVLWYTMVSYGLLSAILIHFLNNFIILIFFREKWLKKSLIR